MRTFVPRRVLLILHFKLIHPPMFYIWHGSLGHIKTSDLTKTGILMRKVWSLSPDYNEQKAIKRINFLRSESVHKLYIAKK